MEAGHTSETSVYFYETTQCYIPEGSHLHSHQAENLKFHIIKKVKTEESNSMSRLSINSKFMQS
jgi:hypothetical protein